MSCGCGCDNDNPNGYAYVGDGLKFAVTMTCEGFDMNEDEWEITVSRGAKTEVFTPANSIYSEDDDQWYICFDSSEFGPGEMWITFVALVPDDDFTEGVRRESEEFPLINLKSTKLKRS